MNIERIAIMGGWILFTCFVAFLGTFYIQRELAKGPQLASKYADMIKKEGFVGNDVVEGFASALSYKEMVNQPLINFYIASSYNTCCTGEFQNGYVDLKALETIINHGVRAIDLEIYIFQDSQLVLAILSCLSTQDVYALLIIRQVQKLNLRPATLTST